VTELPEIKLNVRKGYFKLIGLMSDEKAVSLYRCVQLATMICEPPPVRRIIGYPVIQAEAYIVMHMERGKAGKTPRETQRQFMGV
jgi:hypothetical protein